MSTKIEWTNETWNPVVGCTIVSPGCTNCYAMKMAHRIGPNFPHYAGLTALTKGGPVWTGKVATAPDAIFLQPLSWKKPRRIFVNSMSDLFHPDIADATIDRVFAVMALTPHHTYQVLTKRAERMRDYCRLIDNEPVRDTVRRIVAAWPGNAPVPAEITFPLPNVWLGVSAEDQRRAGERIPLLLDTPAAVRWVSAEPLLGAVDFGGGDMLDGADNLNALTGLRDNAHGKRFTGTKLDWVVAGGESGPGARPAHPDWFRALRDQCAAAGVPFFFKQWGAWHPDAWAFTEVGTGACPPPKMKIGKKAAGHVLDGAVHQAWPT